MTSPTPLSIVFAGTPEFAATVLEALIKRSSHRVVAVYSQPDRKAGRGRALRPSAVKVVAQEAGLPVYQPQSLRDGSVQKELAALGADIMVVVAYGLILPVPVLETFPRGCVNVHASLLPRWRGAAPIQRAIEAGDEQTGVTIMQMDAGLDTGDMLATSTIAIGSRETAQSLHDRLAEQGAELLLQTLDNIAADRAVAVPQDDRQACYADKLQKQEGMIDWRRPALDLDRQVRAFTPWPGAFTLFDDSNMKVLEAQVTEGAADASPGTIVGCTGEGIEVATGEGVLRLIKVQLPGGKPLGARDFLNARQQVKAGYRLGAG